MWALGQGPDTSADMRSFQDVIHNVRLKCNNGWRLQTLVHVTAVHVCMQFEM